MNKYVYDRFQTNEAFDKYNRLSSDSDKQKSVTRMNEEELTKQRLDSYTLEIKAEKRDGFQTLIQCFMFILASGIALIIHWKMAQKSRVS